MRRLVAAFMMVFAGGIAAAAQDEHAAHQEPAGQAATGELAPRTPIPVLDDAARAAAIPPQAGHAVHGSRVHGLLVAERFELARLHGTSLLAWQVDGWLGTDVSRLWLHSEGERGRGQLGNAYAEALHGRSIAVWWDVLAGLRHDLRPGRARTRAAVGVQGLAPQRIELRAMAYVGADSRLAAQLETAHDVLVTNRFILQPALQLDLHARNDVSRGIGSGLTQLETGVRARYEFTRRLAPYVGIEWRRALGRTATLRRAAGEPVGDTVVVAGLRTWL